MLSRFSWKVVAIVYCDTSVCFGQQTWEKTKEDMKKVFKANGIQVSYEAKMPMEYNLPEIDRVLEEIQTKARSEYILFLLSDVGSRFILLY